MRDQIRQYIVRELLDDDGEGLGDETDLLALGVLDSIGVLRLMGFLNRTFDVELAPEAMDPEELRTVAAIERLVRRACSS
jgi:acyl carrier protein